MGLWAREASLWARGLVANGPVAHGLVGKPGARGPVGSQAHSTDPWACEGLVGTVRTALGLYNFP